jgi:hypothetical protein
MNHTQNRRSMQKVVANILFVILTLALGLVIALATQLVWIPTK